MGEKASCRLVNKADAEDRSYEVGKARMVEIVSRRRRNHRILQEICFKVEILKFGNLV